MKFDIVAITHEAGGIRFSWPDGPEDIFKTPIMLAEAYARVRRKMAAAEWMMRNSISDILDQLEKVDPENPLCKQLRRELLAILQLMQN